MLSLASIDQQYFSGEAEQSWHVQTNRIHDHENIAQLRHYGLDLAQKKTPALHHVLIYYEGLRRNPFMAPLREDFDEAVPLKLGLGGYVNIADVSAPEIEKAWFRMQANTRFPWVSQRRGVRAIEFPIKIYSDLIIHNFLTLRETAMPQYGRITATLGDRLYDYWRLALPLTNDGKQVDQIMTIVVNQFPGVFRLLG
jgi:hypothetical protein